MLLEMPYPIYIGLGFLAGATIATLGQHLLRKKRNASAPRRLQAAPARAPHELPKRLKLFETIAANAAESIIVADANEKIAYVNPAFLQLHGYTQEDILGKTPAILQGGQQSPEIHAEIKASLERNETWSGILINRTKNAKRVSLETVISPVQDDAGKRIGCIAVGRDLTHQNLLEAQLRHAQKMEAIGTLAGGIAHDFNNQLAVITGYAQLLHQRLNDPQLHGFVTPIIDAAQRAADLTRQLLAFARKGHFQSISIDLHVLIEETIAVLSRSVDKRIVFATHLKATPSTVLGDPTMLQSMLLNLAINARDALPEGGEIGFATTIRSLDADYCASVPYDLQPGPYLCLSVTDNGIGIPRNMRDHIFEPFFTTKEIGRGTGLGLASVYGTVKQHRGAINVYSEAGHGTTFRIYLPPEDSDSAYESSDSTRSAVLAPAPVRILVVDDEELFRQLAIDLLQPLGYLVVTKSDGAAAIAYYAEHWRDIDLVVLDMIMPVMGGPDTFKALASINPAVRVLLASGYSLNGTAQRLLDDGVAGFIQKPFNQAEISRLLASLLEADA